MKIHGLDVTTALGVTLLTDFHLDSAPGKPVVVTGPSGSGKSTLLEVLAGVSPHRIQGEVVWENSRRRVLAVQEAQEAFSPYRRLGAQLIDGIQGALEAYRVRFLTISGELGLSKPERLWEKFAHELSQGMLKRVLIAAVLAMEGSRVLLDEPTAGVDPSLRWAVWTAISKHAQDAIVSSHDPEILALWPGATVVALGTGRKP